MLIFRKQIVESHISFLIADRSTTGSFVSLIKIEYVKYIITVTSRNIKIFNEKLIVEVLTSAGGFTFGFVRLLAVNLY